MLVASENLATYHNSSSLLSAKPRNSALTSARIFSRGAVIGLGQVVDDLAECGLAGAALDDLDRDRVGLEHPLGREQHPSALRLVVDEPHAPRQARTGLGVDAALGIAHGVLQSLGTKAPGGTCLGAT